MEQSIPVAVEERLADAQVPAYLATCVDGKPHVAPLWYRYEDGTVEILTTGQKLANLRRNPKVSLAVEQDDAGIPEWEVTILGTARVIEEEGEAREANRKLNRKYGVEDDSWEGENTLVRIDVSSVSSKTWD
jgi:nitroimidazol reductase NimA-like FMN-containing flavoprotein (pyridoxamine 5'-phosphate oxidase superfamily)